MSFNITKNPQFDGADDFTFAIAHNTQGYTGKQDFDEGWEGASWGYAPTIATDENGKKLKKRYLKIAEALEEANKHSTVLAITMTRALSDGTPTGSFWFSLRGSRKVLTGTKSEQKEELTWVKL